MLSWGADKTLENTLKSYARHKLELLDLDRIILLQEGTREQELLAAYYGFRPISLSTNVGIAQGYRRLLDEAKGAYFLFLENDWELLESPYMQLEFGRYLLMPETINAEVIRLRSRRYPGSPLWTRQFEGREYDRPSHMLDSIHWREEPPGPEIKTIEISGHNHLSKNEYRQDYSTWWYTTAQYANWTNNPHMAKTKFLRDNIYPRLGDRDLEIDIQNWWQQQEFIVAQSDGLFTHNRLD